MDPPVNCKMYICGAETPQETIMSLTQYISQTPMIHTDIEPVGEKWGRRYGMVTEEAKLLIRSLLEALHDFHNNSMCPVHFNESNVVVVTTSGTVKFKGINFQRKTNSLTLANYRNAYQILVETMFGRYTSSGIPEDIKHLLQLMNSSRAIDMESVIRTHASLVPLRDRYQFFMEMYEQIKHVLGNTSVQKDILNALPYHHDWHQKLKGNALLQESFGYTSYNLKGGPIVFLKFYRNTVAHRMDRYLQPLKKNPNIGPLKYTQDDFEKILVVTYPMYLPIIQEALNLHGLL